MDPVRLVKVVHEWPGAVLVPPVSLKVDLEAGKANPKSQIPSPQPQVVGRVLKARQSKETSWWTARATAGEVRSGFTKEEILRKPRQDPRAEGGMFSRLEELLGALTGPR
jgi:hypothetical protein